uniref:Uncharacterized protein n=1 Tax=Rhizophora mucronata TaxID=61149 RepID=A0A2P2P003_RHIMU
MRFFRMFYKLSMHSQLICCSNHNEGKNAKSSPLSLEYEITSTGQTTLSSYEISNLEKRFYL